MTYERMIKRTIWQAKCDECEFEDVRNDKAPREMQCPKCNKWLPFKEVSWVGPDTFKK